MDDGDGLEQTFVSRRTIFLTTRSLRFNKNELQLATKWKMCADEEISSGAEQQFTRQELFRTDEALGNCFFCDGPCNI